jgi:hypothetical protein
MELATIPVPADNGLAQYYTEEASGLFRARISRPVSNGTVTVTPLVSRGRPDRPDRTKVVWRQQVMSARRAECKASPSKLARLLVRFNHVARWIVNAYHSIMWTAEIAGPLARETA